MIIIAYFFLLCSVEYTGFKSYSTPFRLEDVAFRYGPSIFTETPLEENLRFKTFVTLIFMTHNNGVRGKKIGHKANWVPTSMSKVCLNLARLQPEV